MATVVFGLSFQREAEQLPPHRHDPLTDDTAHSLLPGMTAIFRLAFCSMLSDMRTFDLPRKADQETPPGAARLLQCASFRASTVDMKGRSAPDFLLIAVLELTLPEGADAGQAWQAFRTVESKMALLEACGMKKVVQSYSSGERQTVGQNSFVVPGEYPCDASPLSSIFAFYFLGWLTSLRIERSQLRTELAAGPKTTANSGWRIANQRLQILNLSRYFLTNDRTNDASLKGICNALSTKLKLQLRYERALSLHREFEHHLDNTLKIIQSEKLGSVSNLLVILTLLSVPLSFFAAIVAVNMESTIFTSPARVLSDYRIYLLFLVGLAGSLLPFVALKLHDRFRGRK